jgi:lipoprotein-releasing system permease protein
MITVMAGFSGIEELVQKLFSNFDAPLTIVPKEGKTFPDTLVIDESFYSIEGITRVCRVIEEDAWFNYEDYNTVATVKGVDTSYRHISPIDSMMYKGNFFLEKDSFAYAVVGLGVRGELQMPFSPDDPPVIRINAPVRGKKLSRYKENAFNREPIMVSGVFSVNAELDNQFVFTPLGFARGLFDMDSTITSIELGLSPGGDAEEIKQQLLKVLPPSLTVQTRYDKNALVYKTNESEKWATFLILFFILIIACFNIIASLTMLIIEKKKDIYVLGSMGATDLNIRRIFIFEGIFINLVGVVSGTTIGILLCVLQEKFGLLRMEGAMVEFYPVKLQWMDTVGIFITVFIVGSLFSVILVRALMKRFAPSPLN